MRSAVLARVQGFRDTLRKDIPATWGTLLALFLGQSASSRTRRRRVATEWRLKLPSDPYLRRCGVPKGVYLLCKHALCLWRLWEYLVYISPNYAFRP